MGEYMAMSKNFELETLTFFWFNVSVIVKKTKLKTIYDYSSKRRTLRNKKLEFFQIK